MQLPSSIDYSKFFIMWNWTCIIQLTVEIVNVFNVMKNLLVGVKWIVTKSDKVPEQFSYGYEKLKIQNEIHCKSGMLDWILSTFFHQSRLDAVPI